MKNKRLLQLILGVMLAGAVEAWAEDPIVTLQGYSTHASWAQSLTIDGNPADWQWGRIYDEPPLVIDGGPSWMGLTIYYAWDSAYFYFLILETGQAAEALEAPTVADYTTPGAATGPLNYDGVAFWMDLNNNGDGQFDFNPWFGFSSTGQAGLMAARVNNVEGVWENRAMARAQCATSGSFAQHNRVIEARVSWDDMKAYVEPARLNGSTFGFGHTFGCDTLIAENGTRKQRFISPVSIYNCLFVPVRLSEFTAE